MAGPVPSRLSRWMFGKLMLRHFKCGSVREILAAAKAILGGAGGQSGWSRYLQVLPAICSAWGVADVDGAVEWTGADHI